MALAAWLTAFCSLCQLERVVEGHARPAFTMSTYVAGRTWNIVSGAKVSLPRNGGAGKRDLEGDMAWATLSVLAHLRFRLFWGP